MIEIKEYEKFAKRSLGLGQDASTDLTKIIRVAALFVKNSSINTELRNGRLLRVTGNNQGLTDKFTELLTQDEIKLTPRVLIGTRTDKEANSLVQAIFDGQGQRLAIVNWAAENYVSLAVAFGLIDLDRVSDSYFITEYGKKAVDLLDTGDEKKQQGFMLERLLEYPYAGWMLRFAKTRLDNNEPLFSKFDAADAFGFLDDGGFGSLPTRPVEQAIARAQLSGDQEKVKKLKSDRESTGDKYMRWIAGALVKYGFLEKHRDTKKEITVSGQVVTIKVGPTYEITDEGIQILNRFNGGSKHRRSTKRVRWEYFGPKVAYGVKTRRALILKYLKESQSGLKLPEISEKITADFKELLTTDALLADDIQGFNNIGIEISHDGDQFILKDPIFDFDIPVQVDEILSPDTAQMLKEKLRPLLQHVGHDYLTAIDIVFKATTSPQENTELEIKSTRVFDYFGYETTHLGGTNRPDGLAISSEDNWIIDSKAYHDGFSMIKSHTDPMVRYMRELDNRTKIIGQDDYWWEPVDQNLPSRYIYVSREFIGNFIGQNNSLMNLTKHEGAMAPVWKLLLLAELKLRDRLTKKEFIDSLMDPTVTTDDFISEFERKVEQVKK